MKSLHSVCLCLLFIAIIWATITHSEHLLWLVLVTLLVAAYWLYKDGLSKS